MRYLVVGDRGCSGAMLAPVPRATGHEVAGPDLGVHEAFDVRLRAASA
jgi:hypothetical protein